MFTQMYILDAILLFHSTLTSQESTFLYLLVSEMLEICEISKFPTSGKSKKFLAGLFSLSALKSLFKADKENQARDLLKFDLRFK